VCFGTTIRSPHATVCVRMPVYVCACYTMCPHCTICVLIVLHVSSLYYMRPHATICVLMLLYVDDHNLLKTGVYEKGSPRNVDVLRSKSTWQ
jgi:hypothetical protein